MFNNFKVEVVVNQAQVLVQNLAQVQKKVDLDQDLVQKKKVVLVVDLDLKVNSYYF